MDIEFAILARSADLSADGTISALGMGFEIIRTAALPRVFPLCLIVRVKGHQDGGKLLVDIDLIGPSGSSILDAPISQELKPTPRAKENAVAPEGTANIIFNMAGIVLSEFGEYELRFRVTGTEAVERVIALRVLKANA